jgi:hypothetical protein
MGFSPDAVTAEADSCLHLLYSDLKVGVTCTRRSPRILTPPARS